MTIQSCIPTERKSSAAKITNSEKRVFGAKKASCLSNFHSTTSFLNFNQLEMGAHVREVVENFNKQHKNKHKDTISIAAKSSRPQSLYLMNTLHSLNSLRLGLSEAKISQ
jgi:hypothetical protein